VVVVPEELVLVSTKVEVVLDIYRRGNGKTSADSRTDIL